MRYHLCIGFFFLLALEPKLVGQEMKIDSLQRIGVCDEDGFCIPGLDNMPRPKGISVIQERVVDYSISSEFRDSTHTEREEIRRNKEYEINVKFPVLLKDRYNLIMGLEYKTEQFAFEDPENLQNSFYKNLQDKPLRKYGYKIYYTRSFKGNNYLYTRGSLSFNGDLDGSNFKDGTYIDYFRSSFSALYGYKVNGRKSWGFGISGSYNFGEYRVYPIFYYNKQFDTKWGVELRLPLKTELRFMPNQKNIFYFTNRLWGDNYVLDIENQGEGKTYLGISSFRSLLTYEREIYDFLWVTFSAGARFNINFDLSDEEQYFRNRDPFLENNVGDALFIRFGIFIVPPRKMLDKK